MVSHGKTFSNAEKQEIAEIRQLCQQIVEQLHRRIVDMDEIIEQLLICIFSGGHALVVGVPGLAKTLLMRSLSELLELKFSRIQFTPDLMPSDITGTEILVKDEQKASRYFKFLKGPIFANLLLGDEINRTPPKTQAALLEAMEEHSVTSMGKCTVLDPPFFVLATQNPIEQEGTYPLPAAQLDRFMFNLLVDYPSYDVEYSIMRKNIAWENQPLSQMLSKEKILRILHLVRKAKVPQSVMQYAVTLCRMSRPNTPSSPQVIKDYLAWGASPRAAQCLIIGGKARAVLKGRHQATPHDIRSIFHPVMRHRILLNYQAEADEMVPDEILNRLIQKVPAPDGIFKKFRRTKYSSQLYLAGLNR